MPERSVEIVIEVPKGSRNKYEYDHDRHVIRLDRRLFSSTFYPADYGFLPNTLAEDGDPLDALVLVEDPTFPGCHVRGRPIGVFWMTDEEGPDAKIVCIPDGDPAWPDARDVDALPHYLREEIAHFFEVYKALEPGKGTAAGGWGTAQDAWMEIEAATSRATQVSSA